jgi:hypothetical protein
MGTNSYICKRWIIAPLRAVNSSSNEDWPAQRAALLCASINASMMAIKYRQMMKAVKLSGRSSKEMRSGSIGDKQRRSLAFRSLV